MHDQLKFTQDYYVISIGFNVSREEFVQIINVRRNHWITVSSVGCPKNSVKIYDSLPSSSLTARVKQQIASICFCEEKEITVTFANVQRQQGGGDCGLFTIAFAMSLCAGEEPSTLNYAQIKLRQHLIECLENNSITSFPVLQRKRSVRKVNEHQSKILVYCVCRQPHSEKMAECNFCEEWYHDECVKIPLDVWVDKDCVWKYDRC